MCLMLTRVNREESSWSGLKVWEWFIGKEMWCGGSLRVWCGSDLLMRVLGPQQRWYIA